MVGQISVQDLNQHLKAKAIELFGDNNQSLDDQSVREFVKYIGVIIRQDGKPVVLDPGVVREQAQSVFLARLQLTMNTEDVQGKALNQSFMRLMNEDEQALRYSKQKISFAGLDYRDQVGLNKALTTKLRTIRDKANAEIGDPGREGKLVENIVAAALNEAITLDSRNGNRIVEFDQPKYESSLNTLLDANITKLSQATVDKIIVQQDEAGFRATAFAAIHELGSLANVDKISGANDSIIEALEQGKYETVTDADKVEVNQFLIGLLKKQDEGRLNLAEELANLPFGNESQKSYLQHLLQEYRKTDSAGNDLARRIADSIPGMIAPSLIGALVGWIFGGNIGLGMIGAVVLNVLSGLGDNAESVEGKARELPPLYTPKAPEATA